MRLKQIRKLNHFCSIRTLRCLSTITILFVFTQTSQAQKFTIPIFPDSQYAVSHKPELLTRQMEWIVAAKDSLNIPFVLHVGDLVNYDTITHFQIASDAFKILDDANIDYAICLGNHDTEAVNTTNGSAAPGDTKINVRKTTKFNTYFPVERFKAQKGRYEEGKSDNAYYTFEAGGLKWMVVTLEFCARPLVTNWANTIIPQFPDHNVIILTHYHLNRQGDIAYDNAGYGASSPNTIFMQMIRKHANVRFVFCGHISSALSKNRVDIGANGNSIYQMLQDFSTERNQHGDGYLRLVEIDPDAGTISAKMYSPYINYTRNDFSMFSYSDVDFVPAVATNIAYQLTDPSKPTELSIRSNSSTGSLYAEFKSSSDKEVIFSLNALSGQQIAISKQMMTPNNVLKYELEEMGIQSLPKGIYILSVTQGEHTKSGKFIVN